jgi:hypothetical protein
VRATVAVAGEDGDDVIALEVELQAVASNFNVSLTGEPGMYG